MIASRSSSWQHNRFRELVFSSERGANITTTFKGKKVKPTLCAGPEAGLALVNIDGKKVGELDLYNAANTTRDVEYSVPADAKHVLELFVTGKKNAASLNTVVEFQRVEILE